MPRRFIAGTKLRGNSTGCTVSISALARVGSDVGFACKPNNVGEFLLVENAVFGDHFLCMFRHAARKLLSCLSLLNQTIPSTLFILCDASITVRGVRLKRWLFYSDRGRATRLLYDQNVESTNSKQVDKHMHGYFCYTCLRITD